MNEEIKQFVKERNEALLSLDKEKIMAMYKKFNNDLFLPPTVLDRDKIFWVAVHKAITGAKTLPIDFRRQSKAWLDERGFKSLDDGEL